MSNFQSTDDPTGFRCAFLFAHYDDAALNASRMMASCAPGSIDMVACTAAPAGSASARGPVDRRLLTSSGIYRVLNQVLFDRVVYGGWDLACGLRSPREAMRIRRSEHERACAKLGIPTFMLDELDSQYGRSTPLRYEAALSEAVDLVRLHQIDVVVTHPMAARHLDHVRTATLARAVCDRAAIPMLTVCERPYTVCSATTCADPDGAGSSNSTRVTLDDQQWALKNDVIRCYDTQIAGLNKAFAHDWLDRRFLGIECYQTANLGQTSQGPIVFSR